ncbi:unnamed protein product [Heligmosomoides polygyrus]|uniref:Fatty-acid and retinol-binding protein 1 n=1 Tax=Heligmosomoides polygyrus TaxID=6339 RepID=A0A3P8D9C1_HELPZ|nr:unnamed protein product [Heligmosomoides polygyrus]
MLRFGVFLALIVCAFAAAPVRRFEDIPSEIRELLPPNVVKVLKSITPQERQVIGEILQHADKFNTDQEVLDFLKAKSPSLHTKAQAFYTIIEAKVAALGPEAKGFFMKAIFTLYWLFSTNELQVKSALRNLTKHLLAGQRPSAASFDAALAKYTNEFKALSPAAQQQLKTQFPIMTSIIHKALAAKG